MKNQIIILIAFISALSSCSKTEENPNQNNTTASTKFETLSGKNSQKWGLAKLYINDTLYPLTSEQLLYTKTYSKDSSFVDSDGLQGRFDISKDERFLIETLTSGGSGSLVYKINTLSGTNLDCKLIYNGTDSLNTRFVFNAK